MKADRFIALDFGEEYIRMGVFARQRSGQAELLEQGFAAIDSNPETELAREAVVAMTLKRLLDEKKPCVRSAVISVDGSFIFSRLITLPPISPDKVLQTIRHEAVQNIPFPIDEVVWNAHVVDAAAPEPEVLLVAAKAEVIDGLVLAVRANGLSVARVEAAPVALANAVRFCYPDPQESILLVDVGSCATNLVFVDGARTFFRTLSATDASLTGLMQEMERSISFYCGQQHGRAPEQVLLTGKEVDPAALQEKLNLPVSVLDLRKLLGSAGGTVTANGAILGGLAVDDHSRALSVDLIPDSLLQERKRLKRQPWWIACAALLLILAGVWIWGLHALSRRVKQESASVQTRIRALEKIEREMLPLEKRLNVLESRAAGYHSAIVQRTFFLEVLDELRGCLPEGMFLLASEPLNPTDPSRGLRITVVSYLDKEAPGVDVVKQLRDNLRKSKRFSSETRVSSRPSKQLFARQFVLDVFFAEDELK